MHLRKVTDQAPTTKDLTLQVEVNVDLVKLHASDVLANASDCSFVGVVNGPHYDRYKHGRHWASDKNNAM